ncbi:MAG: hypothetical protein NT067_05290 [Candidatus Diapherotrites archaeon]|nr:hypothetical protein [Candidatus Diapherotrites archaeon]
MDEKLSGKLHKLETGDKIKINGKIFTIKEKIAHPAHDEFHSRITRFELGDDFVLEFDWDWKFFQCVQKKGLLGFITKRAAYSEIKEIKILGKKQ